MQPTFTLAAKGHEFSVAGALLADVARTMGRAVRSISGRGSGITSTVKLQMATAQDSLHWTVASFRGLRLRNLDPDQQVRYFYLSTLHRAERIGVPRRASETPSQYAPRLMREVTQQRIKQEAIDAENAANSQHDDGAHTADQHPIVADEIAACQADRGDLEDEQTMQVLTNAFLHVRYAGQSAPSEQIPYLKQMWEKVKQRLRRKVEQS